jgi:hypothetical protein
MRFRQIGGAIGTSAGMQSIPYGRCCGFVDMVRCKIFRGGFSFHEIDVTALFRRNIGTCIPLIYSPWATKNSFGMLFCPIFIFGRMKRWRQTEPTEPRQSASDGEELALL